MQRINEVGSSSKQKINIKSLDFDGCIFNDNYMLTKCDFLIEDSITSENVEDFVENVETKSSDFFILTAEKLFYVNRKRNNRILVVSDINEELREKLNQGLEFEKIKNNRIEELSLSQHRIIKDITGYAHIEPCDEEEEKKDSRAIKANQPFFDALISQAKDEAPDEIKFIIGSNRQSQRSDSRNMRLGKKRSCFPVLEEICGDFNTKLNEGKCELDHYLLCDSYGGREEKEAYEKALELSGLSDEEKSNFDYDFPQFFNDESKVNILYAHMHRAATLNPDAEIIYDFYDDRKDILDDLNDFYKNNKDLIPDNVALRLHQYKGEEVIAYDEIKGEGKADNLYADSIKLMAYCCQPKLTVDELDVNQDYYGNANFAKVLNVAKFKCNRGDTLKLALKKLERQIFEIENRHEGNEFREDKEDFVTSLKALYADLKADIKKQINEGLSPQLIAQSPSAKLVNETSVMLTGIKQGNEDALINYQANCKQITKRKKFWRAVAAVVITASGFLLGAAIGAGVGIAIGAGVGAITGPGAIATGAVGFFAGSVSGAAIGITAGSAAAATITGVTAGAISGCVLFKPNKLARATAKVVTDANKFSR